MRLAMDTASLTVTAMPDSGMGMPSLSIIARNRSRSSAMSMVSGVVPRMLTPFFLSAAARLSGVWPPNCAITPTGFSFSWMASTSSSVSGSK